MFCPLCKAEYRPGCTQCADCGVWLVERLPDAPCGESLAAAADAGPFAVLCREDDPVFLTALVSALDEAHIPHQETAMQDFDASLSQPFPGRHSFARGFQVYVLQSDLDTARRVLIAVEQKASDPPLSSGPAGEVETPEADTSEIPSNWSPERAVAEVWSGEDAQLAQFLVGALRENGIGARTAAQPAAKSILVYPGDSARAREIIREVIEGTPPA